LLLLKPEVVISWCSSWAKARSILSLLLPYLRDQCGPASGSRAACGPPQRFP